MKSKVQNWITKNNTPFLQKNVENWLFKNPKWDRKSSLTKEQYKEKKEFMESVRREIKLQKKDDDWFQVNEKDFYQVKNADYHYLLKHKPQYLEQQTKIYKQLRASPEIQEIEMRQEVERHDPNSEYNIKRKKEKELDVEHSNLVTEYHFNEEKVKKITLRQKQIEERKKQISEQVRKYRY